MPDWEAYVRSRLASAGLRPEREQRIVRQLAEQLEDFCQDALSQGLTADEAQQFARRQIPDWDRLIAEIHRADPSAVRPGGERLSDAALRLGRQRGGLWRICSELLDDLLYGMRVLTKRPGFALVAILTLALGIGASTAIFSVVNGTLLRPLPYPQPDRLAMLWETNLDRGWTRQLVSLANVPAYRACNSIEDLAAIWIRTSLLGGGGHDAETVTNARVEYRFFSTLGVQPALGRAFLPEEDRRNRNAFVILSYGLWMRRFAANPDILGQSLRLDGQPVKIVGVMPQGFGFPAGASLWTPMGRDPAKWGGSGHSHQAILRLKPSASWEQARAELEAVAAALEEEFPDINKGWGVAVVPLREQTVGFVREPLLILLGGAGLLLLIACANVAGLLLAWSSGRTREMAVRSALGAGRRRLVRQLLAEYALLALAGGILGVGLAWGGVRVLLASDRSSQPRMEELLADVASESGQLPRLQEAEIDSLVLAFALSVSLGTILLFGLYPALSSSQFSLQNSLKEGSRGSVGMSGVRLRAALIAVQVALALVLLLGSGLLLRSFQRLLAVDPGFQPEGLLSMRITVPDNRYPEEASQAAFHDRVLEAIRPLPGVEAAASYWFFPFHDGTFPNFYTITKVGERQDRQDPGSRLSALAQICSNDFHELMRIPLLEGRTFTAQDTQKSPYVAVINQTLAAQLWPGESPLGKQFRLQREPTTVVGVAADTKRFGLTAASPPLMYIPYAQNPHTTMGLLVRVSGSPLNLAGPIRSALRRIDAQAALSDVALVEDVIGHSLARQRLTTLLAGAFATTALLLALFGLYGLLTFLAGRRRQEFGIRVALGARASDILSLVLGSGLRLILAGILLGLGVSLALMHFLSSLLYSVSPSDPLTYLVAPFLLLAAALLACYLPARRATRIDPIQALRCE